MSEPEFDRRIALERIDAAQRAFASVIREIDGMGGNEIYRRAWKKVANRVRAMSTALDVVNTTS